MTEIVTLETVVTESVITTLLPESAELGIQGPPGPQGADGLNFSVGAVGLLADRVNYDSEREGFSYLATDNGNMYFREGVSGWSDPVAFRGEQGPDGPSAYEVAVADGFVGTESEWLASLVGAAGPQGPAGSDGSDGLSAYAVAVADGFVGAEAEWLASLVGADGAPGADGLPGANGPPGADGAPGPNLVSTTTATNITGILKGNGTAVTQAVSGTDYDAAGSASSAISAHETTFTHSKIATAVQPDDLATVAMTGGYSDLSGTPTLGTAAATDSTTYATAAQGTKADTALQPDAIGTAVCSQTDARLSDVREWAATTTTQTEAEAGTSTTRRAWTAQRVFQSIAAWWAASAAKSKLDGIATGATANASDAQLRDRSTHTGTQVVGTITGLGGAATLNIGTAAGTVCAGNDTRLSDARTPTSHTHGNITNAGAIGSTTNLPVITTTAGALTTGTFGTAANTFCQGNDSRLSDARTPISHTQAASTITGLGTAATATVTTSASDTTTGRLLRVGDHGVGGDISTPLGTITDITSLSSYINENAGGLQGLLIFSGVPFVPDGSYAVRVWPRGLRGVVWLHDNLGFSLYYTKRTSAGWAPVKRVISNANILGAVSQIGGVPSGAVIERGSNANGEYVRFADGTQICTNANSSITTDPAAFTGTVTSIDSNKLRIGRWF